MRRAAGVAKTPLPFYFAPNKQNFHVINIESTICPVIEAVAAKQVQFQYQLQRMKSFPVNIDHLKNPWLNGQGVE